MGDAVAGQEAAHGGRSRPAQGPDHRHLLRSAAPGARPLVDELGHRSLEELVGGAPGLEHVVVDAPERHCAQDGLPGARVPPGAPVHEQTALDQWEPPPGLLQQLGAGRPRHPLIGQNEGDLAARPGDALEGRPRHLRRVGAHEVVVRGVAALELAPDAGEGAGVVVHGHDRGAARRAAGGIHRSPAQPLSAASTFTRSRPESASAPLVFRCRPSSANQGRPALTAFQSAIRIAGQRLAAARISSFVPA